VSDAEREIPMVRTLKNNGIDEEIKSKI